MPKGTDFRFETRGRMSMTREQALAIMGHKKRKLLPDDLIHEAAEVLRRGEYWIWVS